MKLVRKALVDGIEEIIDRVRQLVFLRSQLYGHLQIWVTSVVSWVPVVVGDILRKVFE